jgi:hypothetical protein
VRTVPSLGGTYACVLLLIPSDTVAQGRIRKLVLGETGGLSPGTQYNPHGVFIALETSGWFLEGTGHSRRFVGRPERVADHLDPSAARKAANPEREYGKHRCTNRQEADPDEVR